MKGDIEDITRELVVVVPDMATRKKAQKGPHQLVKSQRTTAWLVFNETMLLKYDHGWGAMTPTDPVEAQEVTRS